MPRGPALLKVTEPARKDYADVPEAIWQFPHRIVRRATELDLQGQKGLAKKVGLKQPVVSKTLDYTNIRNITAATVMAYATGLDCPMGWLFFGEGETVPSVRPAPTRQLPSGKASDAGRKGSPDGGRKSIGNTRAVRTRVGEVEGETFAKEEDQRFKRPDAPRGRRAKATDD